jgi:hypothetical protein
MEMQKMNRVIFFLLGLFLATAAQTQGPPVRVSEFTVENSTRFKEVPVPMQNFDPGQFAKDAIGVSSIVHMHFPNAKIGKFKKGSLTVILRNKIITSVVLDAPTQKSVKLLLKQMRNQFGDPYKLQSNKDRHFIVWLSDRKSKIDILYESDADYSNATVTIEKR